MLSIRVENLRSFNDTGEVMIKPITVLVGQNSSGKSTFLRTFPLFKQSYESRTRGPILWYGQYVDMGDFITARNKNSDKNEINFHFHFDLTDRSPPSSRISMGRDKSLNTKLMMSVAESSIKGEALIRKYKLQLSGHTIEMDFKDARTVTSLSINSMNFATEAEEFDLHQGGVLLLLRGQSDRQRAIYGMDFVVDDKINTFYNNVKRLLKLYLHGRTSQNKITKLVKRLEVGSAEEMLKNVQSLPTSTQNWKKRVKDWTIESPEFVELQNAVLALNLSRIIRICDVNISVFARNVQYIAPLRASAERYYRVQNLSVDQLDHMGQNLPSFLSHLSYREKVSFSDWMNEHFGFSVKVQSSEGHISLGLTGKGASSNYNLADMGFGFSQILPIIIQLWSYIYGRADKQRQVSYSARLMPYYLVMEQPELHLHPHLQAYLTDALVSIVENAKERKINLRLIVETHSETIVNRLGENIAEGNIANDDVNVVLFDKKDTDANSTLSFGEYDTEGYLKNWPYGFFQPSPVKPRNA